MDARVHYIKFLGLSFIALGSSKLIMWLSMSFCCIMLVKGVISVYQVSWTCLLL